MDKVVKRHALDHEIMVTRGISSLVHAFQTDDYAKIVGRTFTDKGFLSTTVVVDYAQEIATDKGFVLKLQFRKGTAYTIPEAMPGVMVTAEREIILEQGLSFEIMSIDASKTPVEITAKIVDRVTKEDGALPAFVDYPTTSRFEWGPRDLQRGD